MIAGACEAGQTVCWLESTTMTTNVRKRRLLKAVRAAGCDALLVTHLPDVRYLCGFTGSAGVVVVAGGRMVLFTDGRYTEQAKAEATGAKVVIVPKPALTVACEWMSGAGVRRCGFDPANTTVAALEGMRAALPARVRRSFFQAMTEVVGRLRQTKDGTEIEVMRAAADLGCAMFEEVLGELAEAATEVEIALDLERRARRAGAERMSFESIVAGGRRSALPHARPTSARLPKRGFVTLDFGVMWKGYCSDMTRSVHMGRVSAEGRAVYDSVLEAQMRAIACVAPGVTAGEIDEAARSVLRRAKLDEFFSHSTGHGVGLEIHESPRIGAKQTQAMEPGMIITIEPGVYLPGRFGVRIEDMVLVTDRGCEVLTTSTKALIEL